jgi:SUMO ligase MMS21 Smc5/6 complex component
MAPPRAPKSNTAKVVRIASSDDQCDFVLAIDAEAEARIGIELRKAFAPIVNAAIPQRFEDLIQQLVDAADEKNS